jgi:hypothetical protein
MKGMGRRRYAPAWLAAGSPLHGGMWFARLARPLLVRARRLFELGVRDRQYGSDIPAGCIADERLADQKCVVLWRFARKASRENDGDKNLHYVA